MLDRSIHYSMASSQTNLPLHKEPKATGKSDPEKGNKKRKAQHVAPPPETAESKPTATTSLLAKTEGSAKDDDSGRHSENSTENQSPLSAEDSGDDEEGQKSQAQKSFGMLQAKWDEMFTRLVTFSEKHGHCLVPNRYTEDPQLGSWVSTQRRQYKILTSGSSESTPMTPERASKLNSIGFVWATKDPRHVPWETRYEELCQFVEKFGHAQVPIGWEENIQLSNWVSTQRQEYKLLQKGRSSRLDGDRIKLLNDLGFVWEAQRGGPRRGQKATVSVPDEPRARVGGFSDSVPHQASASAISRSESKSSPAAASVTLPSRQQAPSPGLASAVARSRAQDLQNAAVVAQYLEASRAANQPQFIQYAPSAGYQTQGLFAGFSQQGGMMFPNQATLADLSMLQQQQQQQHQRQQQAGLAWPLLYGAPPHAMAVPNITGSAGGILPNYIMNLNQQQQQQQQQRAVAAAREAFVAAQDADDATLQRVEEVPKKSAKKARQKHQESQVVPKAKRPRRSATPPRGRSGKASAKSPAPTQSKAALPTPSKPQRQGETASATTQEEEKQRNVDEMFADAEEDEGSWTTTTEDEHKSGKND